MPNNFYRDPFNAPYYKLSNYKIPGEKKRDDLIYNVRMNLVHASAISFDTYNCDNKTKKENKKIEFGKKRPHSAYASVKAKVNTNLKSQ